jgi:hypothetical protein
MEKKFVRGSVPDPELDPHAFGPPGSASGSVSHQYESRCGCGSGSGFFPVLIQVLGRTEIMVAKKILNKNLLAKNLILIIKHIKHILKSFKLFKFID